MSGVGMRACMRALVVLVAGVMLVAPAAAQEAGLDNPVAPTPTTLFFHLDGIADFPISPQAPPAGHDAAEGGGIAWMSACAPDNPATTLASQQLHTLYGYGAWGDIDYDGPAVTPSGSARGMGYDALLDDTAPAQAVWYLETQLAGGGLGAEAPVFVPGINVAATVRSGDNVSVDDEAYEAGEIIAHGESGLVMLDPTGLTPGSPSSTVFDGRRVYEIPVALQLEQSQIPANQGYNIRIDVRMESPCPDPSDAYLMPNVVRHHSSKDLRPRLEWTTLNPVRIDFLRPSVDGEATMVEARASTPWGPAGLDGDALQLTVEGNKDAAFALTRTVRGHEVLADGFKPVHAHRQDPGNEQYLWIWHDKPDSGVVSFHVNVGDLAGTNATASAWIDFSKGQAMAATLAGLEPNSIEGGRDTPGVGPALLLAMLASVALAIRRARD